MDKKIKIRYDRIINMMHFDADKLISHKNDFLAAFDNDSIINNFSDILHRENSADISEIIIALQKHADDNLAGIINSLQQHINRNLCKLVDSIKKINKTDRSGKRVKSSCVHSYVKESPPTVARLLGEVISDFLVGLSKNESNLIVQNITSSIADYFENIDSNRFRSSQSLLSILELLSSPVCFTDERCKASNDKIHQLKVGNNETN